MFSGLRFCSRKHAFVWHSRVAFGPCGLQEESPQSGKITSQFSRLQFYRIGYHRGLVKSSLSRLLHLGVTMSRISKCRRRLHCSGWSSEIWSRRLYRGALCLNLDCSIETLTAVLVATSVFTYNIYKKAVRSDAGDGSEGHPAELSRVVYLVHQDALSMRSLIIPETWRMPGFFVV